LSLASQYNPLLWYWGYTSLALDEDDPLGNLVVPLLNAGLINPFMSGQLDDYQNSVVGNIVMDYPPAINIQKIIATNSGIDRTGMCCFYPQPNFGGQPLCLTANMANLGGYNDIIASWKCSVGRYAILYANVNYGGYSFETPCADIQNSVTNLNLVNKISSIQIFDCDTLFYGGIGCYFYKEVHYNGTFLNSQVSVPSLVGVDFPDSTPSIDEINSIFCWQGYGAILYDDINYGGESLELIPGGRFSQLSDIGWADEIASFKIYSASYCCFYSEANYAGNEFCTSFNVLKLGPTYFQTISSWTCDGASVNLYPSVNLQGTPLETICGDSENDASTVGWNDKAESLSIFNCVDYSTNYL